jgi:hypothetical protein
MPQQSINALDRRVYSSENDIISKAVVNSTEQTISVTDIISEGPIEGLVRGTASVFLNNDSLDADENAVFNNTILQATLDTSNGKNVPILTNGSIFSAVDSDEGARFLQIFESHVINVDTVHTMAQIPYPISPSLPWLINTLGNTNWNTMGATEHSPSDGAFAGRPYIIKSLGNTPTSEWVSLGASSSPSVGELFFGAHYVANSSGTTGAFYDRRVTFSTTPAGTGTAIQSTSGGAYTQGYVQARLRRTGGAALGTAFDTSIANINVKTITEGFTTIDLELGEETWVGGYIKDTDTGKDSTVYVYNFWQNQGIINEYANSSGRLLVNTFLEIDTIDTDNNIVVLKNNVPSSIVTGDYKFAITGPVIQGRTDTRNTAGSSSKYKGASVELNVGTLNQDPLSNLEGQGSASVSLSPVNPSLEKFQTSNYTTFSAAGAQASQIDELKIIVQYENGLYLQSDRSGRYYRAGVAYHIELAINTGVGTPVFRTINPPEGMPNFALADGSRLWVQTGIRKSKFASEFRINLEGIQPFTGFSVRMSRITKHDSQDFTLFNSLGGEAKGRGGITDRMVSGPGGQGGAYASGDEKSYIGTYTSRVTQVLGIIKDKLNYPFTAYANVRFSSKTFQSSPTRGYECRGLKIAVPSNYMTREEGDGLSAKYTRISENSIGSAIRLWDGSFRTNEDGSLRRIYTDNPAWVFYDICTNNRYGLGDFLKASDMDKFSLYKVAKYCDELVPDGKGGQEPRFRANLYITKSTDAYKILKDFATIFRGILYWSDSQFKAVIDEPAEPIYTFSRSNVINGQFEYQSTGAKTRTNQVIVSWNNPAAEYKLEPIIIEDRENIIQTGVIKTEKAVAFGCTSEGQAIRYGRWKLWTAVNQTDLVSFKTGVNAAFLSPGDVINIQNDTDYRVPFSGRVSSYSTGGNNITIDREVHDEYNSAYSYTLCVVVPVRTIVLNQETATLANSAGGTTTFERGDRVTHATVGGATTLLLNSSEDLTQRQIESAVDTSGNFVNLQYVEETAVEERVLNSTNSGYTTSNGKDTIAFLGGAFSTAPTAGDVWAIKQVATATGVSTPPSYKEYKILDVAESGSTEYDITAVEFHNSKFEAVDNDFSLATEDPLYPREDSTIQVPRPLNVRLLRTPNPELPGEELVLEWDAPLKLVATNGAFSEYEHLAEYEVEHTFGRENSFVSGTRVDPLNRSVSFTGVPSGDQQVAVTTISKTGRRSQKALFNIEVSDLFEGTYDRIGGIVKGGNSTRDLDAPTSAGLVSFSGKSYVAAPFPAPTSGKRNTVTDADSYQLSCAPLSSSSWPTGAVAYMMMDFSLLDAANPNANCLKLITRKVDTTTFESPIDYWYDGTKYINSAASIWTSLGNVSVTKNTSRVVGSGFSSLKVPEVVTIGSSFAGKVAFIASDTVMYLDRSWTASSATGQALSKQELDIDFEEDFLIAPVSYVSSTYKLGGANGLTTFLNITPELDLLSRTLSISSNILAIDYSYGGQQNTAYSSIVLNMIATGFEEPEFNVIGTGFNRLSGSADGTTSFTADADGVFSKVVHNNTSLTYNAASLDFTVKVREALDPTNTLKQRTVSYSITTVKESVAPVAGAGFTATFSPLDYAYRMNSLGVISSSDSYTGVASVINTGTAYTFATSGTASNTYGVQISGYIGGISAGQVVVGTANSNLSLTIASSAGIITTQSVVSAGFTVKLIDLSDSNSTIAVFGVALSKIPLTTRNGISKTYIITDTNLMTAWKATGLVTSTTYTAAVVNLVLGDTTLPKDGLTQVNRIVPNDKITLKVNSTPPVVATRVYLGEATDAASTAQNVNLWSPPVVQEFDGSVIVNGTLSAESLAADFATINDLKVGSNMVLGHDHGGGQGVEGAFYTPNKTTKDSTSKGFFLDTDGNFSLGGTHNGTDSFFKYTASTGALSLGGTFSIAGPDGPASKTITIYKLSAATTASTSTPSNSATVTFSSGAVVFTGSFASGDSNIKSNGWCVTAPATTTSLPYLHTKQAFVTSATTQTIVATGTWTNGGIISGPAGPAGIEASFPAILTLHLSDANIAKFVTNSGSYNATDAKALFSTGIGRAVLSGDSILLRSTTAGNAAKAVTYNGTNFVAIIGLIDGSMMVTDTITADKMAANSITASELQISNNAAGSAGIFMDYNSGNSSIEIRDSSAVRVKLGYLS